MATLRHDKKENILYGFINETWNNWYYLNDNNNKEKYMQQLIDTIKYWSDKYDFDEEDRAIAEEIIAQLEADKEEFDEEDEYEEE